MKYGTHIDYKFCPMCASELKEGEVDDALRRYCPECGWIHYLNPALVVCIIAYCADKVVLVKRGVEPAKGDWALPGGFVDVLEEPRDAARRELKEEAGINPAGEFVLIDAVHQDSSRYTSVVVIGYSVCLDEELVLQAGDDVVDAMWVDASKVKDLPFESFNRIFEVWKQRKTGGVL